MTDRDWITTLDAARILDCSIRSVHRFVHEGAVLVPVMRVRVGPNGAFLFERSDVEQLARKRARARTKEGQATLDLHVDDVDDPDNVLDPAV